MDGNLYWVYSGMRSGVRIEYNKDLLEKSGYTEIPKTLDEYIDMAKKITEEEMASIMERIYFIFSI